MTMERADSQHGPAEGHLNATRKSDILEQLSQRPPRNGGLTKLNTLEDWAEFSNERKFESIRKYLLEADPAQLPNAPKPEARKHFLESLFRSRSNRRSSKQSRKMRQMQLLDEERTLPVLTQRTSKGGRYGQIVTSQVYDAHHNASTYKVNLGRDALAGKETRKVCQAKDSIKGPRGDISLPLKVNGLKSLIHPAHRLSTHKAHDYQSPAQNSQSYEVISHQQATVQGLTNNCVVDTQIRDPGPGQSIDDTAKPMIDALPRPIHHTNESVFGLSKEHSHLLLRDDKKVGAPGVSQISVTEANRQPNIRDFAPEGPVTVQRSRAVRARSRSPVKKIGKQKCTTTSATTLSIFPTYDGQPPDFEATAPRTRKPVPNYTSMPLQGPPSPPILLSPGSKTFLKPSSTTDSLPKDPSMLSAGSNPEDIYSESSSVVVSNAQSAILIRSEGASDTHTCTPPQPGPAPTRALPSLPEGQPPLTPQQLSECDQPSPECLLPIKAPPKSPARYRYTPMDANGPPRKPQESPPKSVNTEAKETKSPLVVAPTKPPREQCKSGAVEKAQPLPKGVNVSDIEKRKQQRVESIKVIKARDMTRIKTQEAAVEMSEPDTIAGANTEVGNGCENREVRHEGLVLLPSPTDLEDNRSAPPSCFAEHHDSQLSGLSSSTALLHRNSSTLSHPYSQNLSPVIVVAEQEPSYSRVSVPHAYSQKGQSTTENQRCPLTFKSSNSLRPFPFPVTSKPLAPSLHFPSNDEKDIGIELRPSSADSIPQTTPTSISNNNDPIQACAPAPFSPSLTRAQSLTRRSSRSQHSSMDTHHVDAHMNAGKERGLHLSELEARIEAVERKNLLLERAFLAAVDGMAGLEGRRVDRLSGLSVASGISAVEGRRASAASGNESAAGSLYAGLENLLALHAGVFGASDRVRLSTASVP